VSKNKTILRVIDAPLYRYWQALFMAFYSRRLYVDVAKRWRGYGILYVLFVVALLCFPLSARITYQFDRYFEEKVMSPLKALPVLQIQNGNIVFENPMPYVVKNNSGKIVAMIDTTGGTKDMSALSPDLTILFTKNKIFFRPPTLQLFFYTRHTGKGNDVYVQELNKDSNEIFVPKDWALSSGILKVKWMVELLIYPLLTGFIFGIDVVVMLFLAFIGQLLSIIIFKYKMSLKDSCRLFLVAATPQMITFVLFLTASIRSPGGGFLYLVLLSVYFSYAVLSVKRESTRIVST
jgi:hypothetical protein